MVAIQQVLPHITRELNVFGVMLYHCVRSSFHSLFHYMEAIGVLNPADESDLFVLHSVFLPRINNALHEFALACNLHPMQTTCLLKEYFTVVI